MKVYRRRSTRDGWSGWYASVGTNTAAMAAFASDPSPRLGRNMLVDMDNDNFVTREIFEDLFANADGLSSGALKGVFFRHPQCQATTGRIACGMRAFYETGGYDESLEPLGYEDFFGHACTHSGLSLLCCSCDFAALSVVPLFSM